MFFELGPPNRSMNWPEEKCLGAIGVNFVKPLLHSCIPIVSEELSQVHHYRPGMCKKEPLFV